jgi:membrane protein YqaA with SNARE-associated domain
MSLLLDSEIWLLVLVVSALGMVAPLTYYFVGQRGTDAVLARFPQISQEQWDRAHKFYQEYGSWSLFFSSIPMAGLLLCTAAGVLGIRILTFAWWVLLGRIVRNWLILILFDQTLQLLFGGADRFFS